MKEISPAAQAVRPDINEIIRALQPHCKISYSMTDDFLPITIETNQRGLEAAVDSLINSNTRLVTEQKCEERKFIHRKLIALVNELENL